MTDVKVSQAYRKAADALAEAMTPFAKANVVEPNGAIVGLERWHFERAAEALAAYQEARHG